MNLVKLKQNYLNFDYCDICEKAIPCGEEIYHNAGEHQVLGAYCIGCGDKILSSEQKAKVSEDV